MSFKNIKFGKDEDSEELKLPIEYIGLLSSVSYGLDYKGETRDLLSLTEDDEEVLFVFLVEIIKMGILGKNRRLVKTKADLKDLQKEIESFVLKVKKGEIEGSCLTYYGIFSATIKSKDGKSYDLKIDSQSFEEMYLWFENNDLKVTLNEGLLIDKDMEETMKNNDLKERVDEKISNMENLTDEMKREILNAFLMPFKYDNHKSMDTKLMYLSTAKKYINIMRGSIWHVIPANERLFGGSWIMKENSILTSKEEIFRSFSITSLIDKYL